MICPVCKKEIPDGAEFCPICGANLKGSTQVVNEVNNQIQNSSIPVATPIEKAPESVTKKNNTPLIIVLIIVVVLIAIGVIISLSKDKKTEDNPTTTATVTTTTGEMDETALYRNVIKKYDYNYDENKDLLIDNSHRPTNPKVDNYLYGVVKSGSVSVGDKVQVIGGDKETITTTVLDIRLNDKVVTSAKAGDAIDIKLDNYEEKYLQNYQSIIKPDSEVARTNFIAKFYVTTKDEGGRHTPFFTNYRPEFEFRANSSTYVYSLSVSSVTGIVTLPEGVEMVKPGDEVKDVPIELVEKMVVREGDNFILSEGSKVIGIGIVTKVIE